MHCFRCHAENAEGSKFCGHCGAPMGGPSVAHDVMPRVTGPTTQMPAGAGAADAGLPPLTREGLPMVDDSLGGSIRVPVSRGARVAMIVIVLAIDLAMAAAGIVLLTRARGGERAAATGAVDAGTLVAVTDGGVIVEVVPDAASVGGGGGRGTGAVPVGGGGGRGTGVGTGGSSGTGGGRATGTSGGGTPSPLPIDAGPTPPRPDAAPSSGAPDAAPTPASTPDAAPSPTSPTPDAAPAPDDPNADSLPDQVAVKLQQSQSRLSRCYTQATKGLPEDEPLSGEVDIAFEVMPTGETRNVTVARNTTGSNQLATCISDVVASWAFESFTGEPVNMQRTFRFRGQG